MKASRMFESRAPEHNALRSRGFPDPNSVGRQTPRAVLQAHAAESALRRELERKRSVMYAAQDAVRALKAAGKDAREQASVARQARQEYLLLNPDGMSCLAGHRA